MPQLEEGDALPEFTLPTNRNREVSRDDLRATKSVIYFYPKDNTSGCTRQAQDFSGLREQFEAAGTRIIGVSADSLASHDKFASRHGLDIELASDETHKTLKRFGVWKEKSMYGRRFFGIERTTLLVDRSGVIRKIWRKVRVPGHAAEVLEHARRLDAA